MIHDHKLWGCKYVVIGGMLVEFRNLDGFVNFAVKVSKSVCFLIDVGLIFSYYNYSFELEKFGELIGLDIFVVESDFVIFFFEIDTYWIQYGGVNLVSWLCKLKGCTFLVYLKDMVMLGGEQFYVEVGEGNLEWEEIIEVCC